MAELPSLGALRPALLQPVDAPSTLYERAAQYIKPWRIEFRQVIEPVGKASLQHVIRITVRDGVVSRQRDMLAALTKKFAPLFSEGYTPMKNSGKLFTTCSDHTKSTLEWSFTTEYIGTMPQYGIPPATALPGGSPYMFLKMALGDQPVELAESLYTWTPVPGEAPTVSMESWLLKRESDVEEKDLGQGRRFLRGLGFAESAEGAEFGGRASRR